MSPIDSSIQWHNFQNAHSHVFGKLLQCDYATFVFRASRIWVSEETEIIISKCKTVNNSDINICQTKLEKNCAAISKDRKLYLYLFIVRLMKFAVWLRDASQYGEPRSLRTLPAYRNTTRDRRNIDSICKTVWRVLSLIMYDVCKIRSRSNMS